MELGRTDSIDSTLSNWAVLEPFSIVGGGSIVVAQGESLPTKWSVVNAGKTPTLRDGNPSPAKDYKALISGAFGTTDDCHDGMTIAHGSASSATDPGLNKDSSIRPKYVAASGLAEKQTEHEWCRLLHLVKGKHGFPGSSILMTLWIEKDKSPELFSTPCKRSQPGPITIKATIKNLKVLDDTDVFGAGEVNAVLALYVGDFSRSTRSEVGMVSVSSGSSFPQNKLPKTLSLCVKPGDTVVATLWGWDDDNAHSAFDGVYDGEDEVMRGVTLELTGPGFNAGMHKLTSKHFEIDLDIVKTP